MSIAVLRGQPQNESTELESLLYSMLYAATKGNLHWQSHLHLTRHAETAAMVVDNEFESLVLSHIDDAVLKSVATGLRSLFFWKEKCLQGIQAQDFMLAMNHGQISSWHAKAGHDCGVCTSCMFVSQITSCTSIRY